jgi:FG-GAP-like repeat
MQKYSEVATWGFKVAKLLAIFVGLTSCGGGSSSGTAAQPVPVTPIPVLATSYLNAKSVGFGGAKLPFDPYTAIAHTFADFKRNGEYQLFVATVGYDVNNAATYSNRGIFKIYSKQSDGSFLEDKSSLTDTVGCLHPRKAIIADFNQDGRPDIFVGCTGIDAAPFPGEKSALILSKPNGSYSKTYMDFAAYAHGSSAADLNGDGYPDIVITDTSVNLKPLILINNKDGTFAKRTDLIPSNLKWKQIYSAELIDINKDGKLDLLLAGHEWDDGFHANISPSIYFGNGTADFSSITPTSLPTVANEGVTLDMTFDSGSIYLLRTSGGDGTFYLSTVIQKISYPSLVSSVIFNSNRASNSGFPWMPWMVLANGKLIGTSDKFSYSAAP